MDDMPSRPLFPQTAEDPYGLANIQIDQDEPVMFEDRTEMIKHKQNLRLMEQLNKQNLRYYQNQVDAIEQKKPKVISKYAKLNNKSTLHTD
jgi:pyruvate/2-oxoglutarate/acetoin dehydrogenase E1 component